jgi:hypothetical protein
MTTPNQRQTLSEFYTELQGAKKEVLNWPCGDNRAMAIDFIARGIGELVAAEVAAERGASIERHCQRIRQLLDLVYQF